MREPDEDRIAASAENARPGPWQPQPVPDPAPDASLVEKADVAVTQAVAPLRKHPLVRLLGVVGEIGDQPPLIALSLATLAAGVAVRRPRMAVAGAHMLAAQLLATAAKTAIKARVDRTRPSMLVEEGRYAMQAGRRHEGAWSSFPSGHTAGAVAVARALVRHHPPSARWAYPLAALVAAIQIPRCAHYPSDIGAGALVGLSAEATVNAAVRAAGRRA